MHHTIPTAGATKGPYIPAHKHHATSPHSTTATPPELRALHFLTSARIKQAAVTAHPAA
jgi:hypothetical protein